MNDYDDDIEVEIDRLVLRGLEMTPERAERLRTLVEEELQHLLAQQGWPGSLAGGETAQLGTSSIDLPEVYDDRRLADSLAQRIAELLRDGGEERAQ